MSFSYFLIYIIAVQVVEINSRTSTLWKLNSENGKIVSFSKNGQVTCTQYTKFHECYQLCVDTHHD